MAREQDLGYLKPLEQLLRTFRSSIGEKAALSLALTFVTVCRNEGKGVMEIAEITGNTKSTTSRHLLDLSERLRSGKEGYDLLQRTPDPDNMRAVGYTLTNRGKNLRESLRNIME